MMRRLSFTRANDGNVAVEFAVVIGVFLMLLLGVIEFARIYWTWNEAERTLEAAGRYAMVYSPLLYTKGPPNSCESGQTTFQDCVTDIVQDGSLIGAYFTNITAVCAPDVSCCSSGTCNPSNANETMTISADVLYGPFNLGSSVTVPLTGPSPSG